MAKGTASAGGSGPRGLTTSPGPPPVVYETIQDKVPWSDANLATAGVLTKGQLADIRAYTANAYSAWNHRLRHGGLTPAQQSRVNAVQKALLAGSTDRPIAVYRHSSSIGLAAGENPQVGGILTDKGFTSTSLNPSFAGGGYYHMTIEVPQGSPGLAVRSISKFPLENEFLVPHGSKYQVISAVEHPGVYPGAKSEWDLRLRLLPREAP